MPAPSHALGLYIHIPFCDRLCHYCDFVKTAWHNHQDQNAYIEAVQKRLQTFLESEDANLADFARLDSVFLGGGTPSVLGEAYAPLFEQIRPLLREGAEVSIEVNPEHVTSANLETWRALGINRLSLGIQSFQEDGLKYLTRTHSSRTASQAIELAREYFENVNVDLIYAWYGQTEQAWLADIREALSRGARHLSLYALTYEGRTPFARRVQRGVLNPMPDERQESLFHLARVELADVGLVHEEVSNWASPGFETYHNAIYWTGGNYLGVGAGAHSYLTSLGPWGLRFHQSSVWKSFVREPKLDCSIPILDLLERYAYELESERDAEAWIFESVSSGLRTQYGINVDAICAKTGYIWVPRPAIREALERGILKRVDSGQLYLRPDEWFRETSWSLEVAMSFLSRLET